MTKGQDCCDRVFGTGGGTIDVRFSNGDFVNFNSLKSRIMVAAGGGGRFSDGSGSDYRSQDGESSGGSGGGYYYGSSSGHIASAGGGSFFISGHNGCDAIKEESTENNIIHTGQSIHYLEIYFINTLMIYGEGYRWTDKEEEQIGMPSHSDNSIIMGNSGNGYARITVVSIDE